MLSREAYLDQLGAMENDAFFDNRRLECLVCLPNNNKCPGKMQLPMLQWVDAIRLF
jgi:hypothetical protein